MKHNFPPQSTRITSGALALRTSIESLGAAVELLNPKSRAGAVARRAYRDARFAYEIEIAAANPNLPEPRTPTIDARLSICVDAAETERQAAVDRGDEACAGALGRLQEALAELAVIGSDL